MQESPSHQVDDIGAMFAPPARAGLSDARATMPVVTDLSALFPDGGTGRTARLGLLSGRLVRPDAAAYTARQGRPVERPAYWLSDGPATADLWRRLRSAHPTSGLWPLLLSLDSSVGAPDVPWVVGDVAPESAADIDQYGPAEFMRAESTEGLGSAWWRQPGAPTPRRSWAGTARFRRPISRVLAEALAQFLPLDAERRAEYRVARAFAGRALDSPALAEIDTATARARLDELGQAVHNGKECGEVAEDLDPRPAAVRLAAVTEGLALHVYRTPRRPGRDRRRDHQGSFF